ncbi:ATP-binding protein [Desulfoluna sp.]|uniref:ATP-binding protein n=1 Tax=Desulfoluna sp. TaxID=2045199 RepID=UPI00262AA089|nr:ATP-binding protein [Desulfoluna sp.]
MSLRLRVILWVMCFTLILLAGSLFWWFPGAPPAPEVFTGAELELFTAWRLQAAIRMGIFLIVAPLLLLVGLLLCLTWGVTQPLNHLTQAARKIADGEFKTELPPQRGDEFGPFIHTFEGMQTQLQVRDKQLSENAMQLSAIIDNAASALVTIDHSGTLRSFNKAAEHIFGYTAEEMIGENIRHLMPMPYPANHNTYLHRYLQSGIKKIIGTGQEVKGRNKNGDVFPIWIAVSEINISDEQLFVGSLSDITHQKKADAELAKHRDNLRNMIHERTKDLKIAMEKAEAANQAKSNFISNMSHEIRTPMNALLGFLGLTLENRELPEELRHYLDIAHRSAWSLLGILDDILDLSKLEGGRLALDKTPFNLAHLLRDITQTMEITAREKGLSLQLFMGSPLPEFCSGDPMRLRQVLFNLLSNAVKFTHHGGVDIHVEPLKDDEIHFYIKDTGIGIPENKLKSIFEPFAQADDSTTRSYGGTGLGISISRELLELMGGTLWVESQVDTGSTFHIALHLPEAKALRPPSPVLETRHPDPPPARLSILVAEDISENAKLIMIRLKQQGHKTRAVPNGREALDALSEEPFDLILMDIHMPEMDGLEATRAIRCGETCPQIPIIGLTASAGKQDVKECLNAGMNDVITKPIDFERLYIAIATHTRATKVTDLPFQATPWPQIKGVDTTQAMKTWQHPPVYLQSLSSFVQKFAKTPRTLIHAMEEGKIDTLYEQVHAITGAAANLCMTEVHKTCKDIALLLPTGDTESIRPLIESLTPAFHSVSNALENLSEKPPSPSSEPPDIPLDHCRAWFHQLLTALASDNPDQVAPLLAPGTACIPETECLRLQHRIDQFDFRGAEEATQKVLRNMAITLNGEINDGEA